MPAKPVVTAVAAALLATTACGPLAVTGSAAPDRSASPEAAEQTPTTPPAPPMPLKDVPTRYDESANPTTVISAALAKARTDHRPVLLDFGANWCPSCKNTLHVYQDDSVRALLGRYHVVLVDVGRFNRHLDTAHRYGLNLERTGIPAFVVLAPSGEVKVVTGNDAITGDEKATPRRVSTFLGHWWQ